MKKNRILGLLVISCILSLGTAFAASSIKETENNPIFNEEGPIPVEIPDSEYNPIFYPAVYSTSIVNEPQYSTQKALTFDYMGFSQAPSQYRGDAVKVAVIDSGLNYSHEDFPEINGLSGTIDNKSGSWLYYKYNIGYQSRLNDTLGHGTNVASVIASQINQIGCVGIAPNVDLYIFKVTNDNNGYEWTAINSALQYCIDNNIDVVNMSFQAYEHSVTYGSSTIGASTGCSSTMTTMINKCYNAGITLVGAAGNYNTNEPSYPASNNHVISVGSLAESSTTTKAGFSNTYGIDLVAPGYVYVADKGSTSSYKKTSGTSFSAPIVTAAIALYKQKHPNATPSEIESALYNSCDEISGNPAWAGNGRLNIDRFLGLDENSPQSISIISPSNDTLELQVGETYQLQYSVEPSAFTGGVEFTTYETGAISVSSSGLITALAEGEDTVSINPVGFANINDEIDVTVVPKTSTVVETLSDSKTVSFSGSKEGTWEISPQTTYCGLYYSGKNSSATITNKSISEFSNFATSTESSLTVYVDGICNSGTNSVKVSTIDSSGTVIETTNALTGKFGSGSNSSNAKSAGPFTFTPSTAVSGLQIVIGDKCCVTKVSYSYSYTKEITGGGTTKTLSSISITNQTTSFTVGETWSFGGTVTANYSDNSHADVTNDVTFSGNSTSTTGTKTVTVSYTEGDVTKTATYNITVSAQAVTNYTVTFDSNGGTGSMTSKNTNGSTYVTPTCSFTYTGYTFDKWALNSESGTKYSPGQTISGISSNITLYATWTQNSASGDFNGYYSTIDADSSSLLSDLTTLNLSKRKSQVGYNNMGTGTSTNPDNSPYMYTDYDPSTVKYNSENQPYGTKILSFYSGISTTSWNKEHVWPASRLTGGRSGNVVDDDVYMARPTITSENSDRGNSVFYEGRTSSVDGWDPVAAFADTLGVYPNIRGESARIIFYCMTVDSSLVLNELTTNSGNNMGRLSDLLKWNLENPVNDREIRRQSGGEYLQGNRNAFVDHPEYACKIWGNTNSSTRAICSQQPTTDKVLTDLSVSGAPTKTSYYDGESFSPNGLTINAVFEDESTLNVTNLITWDPVKLTTGTTSITGSYTLNGVTKTVTIDNLTVTASPTSSITMVTSMSQLSDGNLVYLATGLTSTDVGVTGKTTNDATVSSSQSSWKQYTVVKSGTTYKLKDGTQYIGTVSSNGFAYDSTGAAITLDTSSNVKVGSRWFVKNGSNYRCYTSLGSYVPFHIYKVPTQTEPKVTDLVLDPTTLTFDVYNDMSSKAISATVTADEGADKTVTWSSSNESVATVSGGIVTPHAYGTATITAKAGDIEKTCNVTVNDSTPADVNGVTLDKKNLTITVGESVTLTATVSPSNAGNKNVTWKTSNSSVATVNNGKVTTLATGTVTITVTTEEGGFTATCDITVSSAPVITYQLEADKTTVSYMSGTNHTVSVGVKLYQYSNGVKGSLIKSSSSNVDTSILGIQYISYEYNSVTYYADVKVTNDGSKLPSSGGGSVSVGKGDVGLPSSGYGTINYTDSVTKSSFTGNACKASDGSIQLKSKDSVSGIVQQVSAGNLAKISITFANINNGVEIYGKNSPYTDAKDLYNDSSKGTLLAKITSAGVSLPADSNGYAAESTTKEYDFTGEYQYIGIKSINGALTISSFKVDYASSGITDEAALQQAIAWGTYFVSLTRTESTCLAEDDDAKLSGLKTVWNELKNEYNEMEPLSKDKFCLSGDPEVIKHYSFIISKFGKSSKYGNDGLEDFVKDSKNQPLAISPNNFSLLPINDITSGSTIVIAFSILGALSIGLYFVEKRRKEE